MRNAPSSPSRQRRRLLLEARARFHRSALNGPEQALWSAVSGGKLGVYFRRQVVIGPFIVDMLASSLGLVVEVDGRGHALRRARDARRDEKLRRLGYVVLRLDAGLVMRDLSRAVARVKEQVERPLHERG